MRRDSLEARFPSRACLSPIAIIGWERVDKALRDLDCEFIRQEGSSPPYRVYWKNGVDQPIILPCLADLPAFVIEKLIDQLARAGVRREEFFRALD